MCRACSDTYEPEPRVKCADCGTMICPYDIRHIVPVAASEEDPETTWTLCEKCVLGFPHVFCTDECGPLFDYEATFGRTDPLLVARLRGHP